jgi:hypothetical protein
LRLIRIDGGELVARFEVVFDGGPRAVVRAQVGVLVNDQRCRLRVCR